MLVRLMIVLAVTVFASCNFFKADAEAEAKSVAEVRKAESALYGTDKNFKFDDNAARNVIAVYEDFVKKYPQSKESPEMLLKAADIQRALKDFQLALGTYTRIETEYPDFEKMPQVIFLEGFVYENELYRLEKAKERYEYFLSKYPNHELSDDVKFSLQNLGKSPEEIIREFEKTAPVIGMPDSTPSS